MKGLWPMNHRDLSEQDRELIKAAFDAIRANYVQGRHHVGAALRAGSGKVYAGVHLESPGQDTCAEAVAVGSAATAGERKLACIVAVKRSGSNPDRPVVMSPCGICRELLYYYGPGMDVIVPTPDGPRKVAIGELLPIPYTQPLTPAAK